MMNRYAVVLSALLVAGLARSQEREPRPNGPNNPNHEELEGMMDAYIISKLQESLDLSDEQFGRMVVAQKKLQDARRSYRRERGEVLRQMRQSLRREDASEAELGPLLSKLDEMRDEHDAEEKKRYADIDSILDVRQRARYRILEMEIQRRLQQLIRQGGERDRPRERSPFGEP
jgi:Spy/CpxP family protein refolding chaperone